MSSPSLRCVDDEVVFHPPPPLHLKADGEQQHDILTNNIETRQDRNGMTCPDLQQEHNAQRSALHKDDEHSPPAVQEERSTKIRLKFDPRAAAASDPAPPSRRLKVALKGNPAALVAGRVHHDVDAAAVSPSLGAVSSGVVTQSLDVAPLQIAQSVLQAVISEFDTNMTLRAILMASHKSSDGVKQGRGRKTVATTKAGTSSSVDADAPLQRHVGVDAYFMRDGCDDGCQSAREELLQWHLGLAKWRREYWLKSRSAKPGPVDLPAQDAVCLASIHIQRLVEWKLHSHTATSAFVLSPSTAHALHALDLGWSNDASREFRDPVDTVANTSYEKVIDAAPCCLADLYDYVRGGAAPALITFLTSKSLDVSLRNGLMELMDLISRNCKKFTGGSSAFVTNWSVVRSAIARELKCSSGGVMTREDGTTLPLKEAERKLSTWFPRRLDTMQQVIRPTIAAPKPPPDAMQSRVSRRLSRGQVAPVVHHVDNEEDEEMSLVARRAAKLSAPEKFAPRKEIVAVDGELFEKIIEDWAQCDKCDAWHRVPYNASSFKSWTCKQIGKECEQLPEPEKLPEPEPLPSKKRGPYKKKSEAQAAVVTLVDDEPIDEVTPPKSKRLRDPKKRVKRDASRSKKRSASSRQKEHANISSSFKRRSDKGQASSSSDSDTPSSSSSSMSSSSDDEPLVRRATRRDRVGGAPAAAAAPPPPRVASLAAIGGGGAALAPAVLQELLVAFNSTAIARRGDASEAQLLKRLRDLVALEAKLKELQRSGGR
jgi:hypothetical protein